MQYSYIHGYLCEFTGEEWVYSDDKSPIGKELRPCPRCGEKPTLEGYDACLGYIPKAIFACCGHGVREGYIDEINHARKTLDKLGEWQVNPDYTITVKLD